MYVAFAVFADAANLSQEGKLNILGVFDAVQVGGFPTVHPRSSFVVRLKGTSEDEGAHTLGFRWLDPSHTELWSSSGDLNVGAGPDPNFEMDLPIIAVIDLPLNGPGPFTMEVSLDGIPTTDVRLFVSGSSPTVMPSAPTMFS